VASQLIRSGTAAAPNYDEGCAAESRPDFIHKLGIAFKEQSETRGWLRFIIKADQLKEKQIAPLLIECDELCRILASSLAIAKGKRRPGD
jgi:four helix bundle protein